MPLPLPHPHPPPSSIKPPSFPRVSSFSPLSRFLSLFLTSMEEKGFLLCVFFAVFFTWGFSFVDARRLSLPRTTVLDVSGSTQASLDILSPSPQSKQIVFEQQERRSPSSSSLSLTLHSRTSIHKSSYKDYKSLVLARLERDSIRFRSLQTRIDLAIAGTTKLDLKPMEKELAVQALDAPLVSGASQGSGEYFCRVGIGSPRKQVYMVVDTGSDVNWLQCAPCADCYQQSDPIFEPSSSSSYASLTCETRQCKSLDVSECRNDSCLYEVSYGDGSYTVGEFATETFTLDGSASMSNVAVGCGHDNEGLFVGAAGLLGLGSGPLSFPSQINASSFSYCLVDRDTDSASTLEFNSLTPPHSITAPLLKNNRLGTFYYLGMTGIGVGGQMLSIPRSSFEVDESGNGGIIVDSGTAVTRLQSDVYNSLRDSFLSGTQHLPSTSGVALFDTCYDLSSRSSVEVPTVSFHFPDGKYLALPAKNYLIPVDSAGTFCLAFAPTTSALSIIGNVQQQGTRVSYDLDNYRVGFSPNEC